MASPPAADSTSSLLLRLLELRQEIYAGLIDAITGRVNVRLGLRSSTTSRFTRILPREIPFKTTNRTRGASSLFTAGTAAQLQGRARPILPEHGHIPW